jgi:hypothetical protein
MRIIAEFYPLMGVLALLIGCYRAYTNRQSIEPDELTVFSWFILWWIWLPTLLVKYVIAKIGGRTL